MKRIGPIATITALNLVLTSATLAVSSSAALASADVGVGVGDRVSDVLASPTNALRATRATNWNGGAFVTPGGQRLTIYVHPRYNYAREEVQSNANWLASYLYFGPELSRATFLLIPPEYIAQYCGASTYGCYEPSSASLYVPWNSFPDGTHWMTVIAHEYGHHVASSRTNPPWLAGTWGPKRWASYVNVCARGRGWDRLSWRARRLVLVESGRGLRRDVRKGRQPRRRVVEQLVASVVMELRPHICSRSRLNRLCSAGRGVTVWLGVVRPVDRTARPQGNPRSPQRPVAS